jgi:hypothetical protein
MTFKSTSKTNAAKILNSEAPPKRISNRRVSFEKIRTRLKAYLSSSTSLPNHSFTDEKTATIFPNYREELISSRPDEILYILAERYRCDLSLRDSTNSSDVLMPPKPTPHFHPHGPEKRWRQSRLRHWYKYGKPNLGKL